MAYGDTLGAPLIGSLVTSMYVILPVIPLYTGAEARYPGFMA